MLLLAALWLGALAAFAASHACCKRNWFSAVAFLRTSLQLVIAFYTSATRAVFNDLACVDIDESTSVLFETPAVSCAGAEYNRLRVLVVVVLVVHVIGVPVGLAALSWFVARRRERDELVDSTVKAAVVATVFQGYRARYHWFKVLDVLRRFALVLLAFAFRQVGGFAMFKNRWTFS